MKKYFILLIILILSGCNQSTQIENDSDMYLKTIGTEKENEVFSETVSEVSSEIESIETTNIEKELIEKEAFSILEHYNGNWMVDDLLAYFFLTDYYNQEYDGRVPNDNDKYIGDEIIIDTKNNKFTISGNDTFNIVNVEDLSPKRLMDMMFSPQSYALGIPFVYDIFGYDFENKEALNQDDTIKMITLIGDAPQNPYGEEVVGFIITKNGDLLFYVGEGTGTYTLKQK